MRLILLLTLLLVVSTSGVVNAGLVVDPMDGKADSKKALLEAGKQIYLHGKLPNGKNISAIVRGDVLLKGSQYACANCHRRSGIGSSEGGDLVPPVVGTSLFSARVGGLHENYTLGEMYNETRPGYTTESLGKALRQGIDPAGRRLSPLMPRFFLTDHDVLALSTYLGSLTVELPPGITENEIHFATITTPGTEISRKAMLDVLTTFFDIKNAGTRNETKRAKYAPFQKKWMYESYRLWKLHVWDLSGPEKSWPAQLQKLYEKQPVFAILGGVGNGDWQNIHHFCEKQELPCLLPQIALPPAQADEDFYSIYFSRGIEIEAMALSNWLISRGDSPQTVIQILHDNHESNVAASTLSKALSSSGRFNLRTLKLKVGEVPSSRFWSTLGDEPGDSVWVLWLDSMDLNGLGQLTKPPPSAIYLSATLQKDITSLQKHPLYKMFTLLSPYQPPGNETNTFRFRNWAHLRKLHVTDLHLQSSTFLAATLAGESLMHMQGNFSRDYFIERIEHMMDNMINPSLYPRLSLAPGQRFAAKGCYVWEMDKDFDTAEWIVP